MPETRTVQTRVPLAWRGDLGYQCPYCALFVAVPRAAWATCPRCPGIPVEETAALLLAEAGFDEDDRGDAVTALLPLLEGLAAMRRGPDAAEWEGQ